MKKTILIVGAVMAVSSMAFARNTVWVWNDTPSNVYVADKWISSSDFTNRHENSETISPGKVCDFQETASDSDSTYGDHTFRNTLGFYFTINGTQLPEYGEFLYYAGYDTNSSLQHSNLNWGELEGTPDSQSTGYTLWLYNGKSGATSNPTTAINQQVNCTDDTNMTLAIQWSAGASSTLSSIVKKIF